MGIVEAAFRQFRKPSGRLAWLTGLGMNVDHEKLWRWGLEHVTVGPDSDILDVGCGGGGAVRILTQAAPHGRVHGIDHSEEVLPVARWVNRTSIKAGQVEIIHGSVSLLPFADGMFDLVTAFKSYIFWPSPIHDLRQVRRVLKPGGMVIVVNEAYPDERFQARNDKWVRLSGIVNLHGPDEYRLRLSRAGYSEVKVATAPDRNWIVAIARA